MGIFGGGRSQRSGGRPGVGIRRTGISLDPGVSAFDGDLRRVSRHTGAARQAPERDQAKQGHRAGRCKAVAGPSVRLCGDLRDAGGAPARQQGGQSSLLHLWLAKTVSS